MQGNSRPNHSPKPEPTVASLQAQVEELQRSLHETHALLLAVHKDVKAPNNDTQIKTLQDERRKAWRACWIGIAVLATALFLTIVPNYSRLEQFYWGEDYPYLYTGGMVVLGIALVLAYFWGKPSRHLSPPPQPRFYQPFPPRNCMF